MPPPRLSLLRVGLLALGIRAMHLMLLMVLDAAFPDYDTSATLRSDHVHVSPAAPDAPHALPIPTVPLPSPAAPSGPFERLLVWDAVFFSEIARRGYEHEQYYAFFPLLPALAGALGASWVPVLAHLASLAGAVAMAVLFAALSARVLQGAPRAAAAATLLLLLGQASVFHTAAYTESVFGALTMAGLYCLYCLGDPDVADDTTASATARAATARTQHNVQRQRRKRRRFFGPLAAACLCFTLASCARSNGFINAGYLAHHAVDTSLAILQEGQLRPFRPSLGSLAEATVALAAGTAAAAAVAAPMAAFQLHGYVAFCCGCPPQGADAGDLGLVAGVMRPLASWVRGRGVCTAACEQQQPATGAAGEGAGEGGACRGDNGTADPIVTSSNSDGICGLQPAQRPAWCSGKLPSIYSHVQERYWGVGLLRYWRAQQAPNFLLAAPALALAAAGCATYAAANLPLLLRGGWARLLPPASSDAAAACGGFLSPAVAVHIYPWAFMAAVSALVMHVQVATRFLSCCPAHYWFMAHLTTGGEDGGASGDDGGVGVASTVSADGGTAAALGPAEGKRRPDQQDDSGKAKEKKARRWRLWLWGLCMGYTILGSTLLPNFYPWT